MRTYAVGPPLSCRLPVARISRGKTTPFPNIHPFQFQPQAETRISGYCFTDYDPGRCSLGCTGPDSPGWPELALTSKDKARQGLSRVNPCRFDRGWHRIFPYFFLIVPLFPCRRQKESIRFLSRYPLILWH
ncbi:hypothetical protein FOWG_05770 [Fusarium oxysporum f. sp. lycopersici MN25]|uniref:Uncharacterized protein n=1 Tax=Fusarium oxysporum Fo47 TaxID=660027 RepID=W9KY45_FUSOX|nr:hypothetical protein FOZG_03530 [Fusarium oxysporum Fo47]EWZ92735.1 hypothetical protein FOWG_05770 [Fusarium oxysporum f. sp. lycopersici MN25]